MATPHDELILQTIDRGMSVLGDKAAQVFWFYLERDFSVKHDEVAQHLDEFYEELQRIFGLGSKPLESLLIRYLEDATGKSFEGFDCFAECARSLCQKPITK